jgi:hypothetical protein
MGVMTTTRKILPLVEVKRARHLRKVKKLNWVHSLIIASNTKLTISMIERLSKDWTSPIYVFSGRRLTLSMWMAVMLTHLNMQLGGVEVGMGGMFVDIWTRVMPSRQVACVSMQQNVGVLKR